MSITARNWLIGGAVVAAVAVAVMLSAGVMLRRRFDPYIREQAVEYLSKRFDSDVSIGKLDISVPRIPLMRLVWDRGKGIIATVTGEKVVLRHKESPGVPPMFTMDRFQFEIDLGEVFAPVKHVSLVRLERMEIQIPPKRQRAPGEEKPSAKPGKHDLDIVINQIVITDSALVILPRDPSRKPLQFDLHRVVLEPVGIGRPLHYRANLTNALPPGRIEANGGFGPWDAVTPGDTPLDGKYAFLDADLGVFPAIQGTLSSTGSFTGSLDSVEAKGEADVPDFRLRDVGHPTPLQAKYEVLVDGTNGNTILKPVRAVLGTTAFSTSGAILKREASRMHSIDLDVNMPDGEMIELLRFASSAKPFMSGRLQMKAKIRIPPLKGTVGDKLILDGVFHIRRGQFLVEEVQGKIDDLSRRGQGQPKNEAIDNVFSGMAGEFHLENQHVRFKSLSFEVPGSKVELAGDYDMKGASLDFQGALRLDAHVSQTVTGWKHWILKAADPFFAKNGAGTFLKIKVSGTAQEPHFGAVW